MRSAVALGVAACCIFLSPSLVFARDKLCDQLREFESKPFPIDAAGKHKPRELLIRMAGLSVACIPIDESVSADFCRNFVENFSVEFHETNVQRLLECYGVKWPRPYLRWTSWKGEVLLDSKSSDRNVTLNLDVEDSKYVDTMRLTVYPREME